ncbi:hypothetical protein H7849_04200 [Alloacidobacterium dinghuense]|uniref:Uncharacterized protein n=1 Tax=Alloacidobacterium dinghuense TaxID=2763107 RepID=A0A7G8BKV9_9BACT|nr:hypothetical protein [Alloacidobacterium dinghuense]QNI33179.1 hypothetical protein H7849_04200 [Alloacidobacterium dinghuense]
MHISRVSPIRVLCAVLVFLAGLAPAAVAQENMVTIPAGTTIMVRMLDSIDSSQNPQGYRFTTVLETNIAVNGTVIVPAGNTVYGRLAVAEQAGRATGSSNLQLELTDIVVNGTGYPIYTSDYEVKGSSSTKRSAKRLLGGAGLGAIIGGIAGNAGMGAAIGVTAGAVGSIAQKGQSIKVPSETLISFRLQQPASLPAPY